MQMRKRLVVASAVFVLGSAIGLQSMSRADDTGGPGLDLVPRGQAECQALAMRAFEELEAPARILEASFVPASTPQGDDATRYALHGRMHAMPIAQGADLPAHCLVTGYVVPQVRFEMRLPTENWNERLLFTACNGFCGEVKSADCIPGLHRNYATVTTDGGHTGSYNFDGLWGYNNPQAEIDFGYRANHVVAQAAKAIIHAYYGKPQNYAYIAGCSKGGQAGLMAAQRYPDDFDGVISVGPVLDYQGKNAIHFPWVAKALEDEQRRPLLSLNHLDMIRNAVLDACDAIDGREDRVIDDPRKCKFDPGVLACSARAQGEQCLDNAQVAALRKVYDTPRNSRGEVIYPAGIVMGSEGEWPEWLLTTPTYPATDNQRGADQYLTYLAFKQDPGPDYDFRSYDLDTALETLKPMSPVYDATSPDLEAFHARGGKIIMIHGMADAAISPLMTAHYYEAMSQFMGGEERAQEFARLFLVPGLQHCYGGNGPDVIDALAELEQWREQGQAPDRLLAKRSVAPFYERVLLPYSRDGKVAE